jgi:PPOX class probable F420-dependent enzyme
MSNQVIPVKFTELLTTKKAYAHLATLMADGSPQVTPVWFEYDGEFIIVNSAVGRTKDRNMKRDARVALSIQDPENPYLYLQIRGTVVEITTEGADASIDRLAFKYMGQERYPGRRPGEIRVIYKIQPQSTTTMG